MDIGAMYGVIVVVVVALAWLGHDHVSQKLAILLLVAWASTNLVVNYFGFHGAAMINPSIDAVIALLVASLGFRNKSPLALGVFLLYGAVGATWVGAWLLHQQESRPLYDVLGALFLAQLSAVGGTSGGLALRHWLASRHPRFRAHPLGG